LRRIIVNAPEIIVGIDGSPASRAALLWAAADADRRDIPLNVIHAYEWRRPGSRMALGGAYADAAREQAESMVAAAIADVRAAYPGLDVRGEAVLGHPGPALLAAAADAALLVLGSRGHGGFASLLLGSISQQVATHAAGPVVVIRGRTDIDGGPVVVGVDGSDAAHKALDVAFDEAKARECGLVAVRVYSPTNPPWGRDDTPFVEDWEQRREAEQALLVEEVTPWLEKHPAVPVECVAISGHPAEVLTGLSTTAQLAVVGMRGHGGFAGLLLGSVGVQLLHHADCPVLIARAAKAEAPTT
jgi:nucleotide-binding universal stress UspA family protein